MARIFYTVVKSQILGDSFDEATYEIRAQEDGKFLISATPTRGSARGITTSVGDCGSQRFPTLEAAKHWLESQPGLGKQSWFEKYEP